MNLGVRVGSATHPIARLNRKVNRIKVNVGISFSILLSPLRHEKAA